MNEHKHIWKFSNVPLTLQVSKKFPSFPSFRFQYKDQNQKLGNLENLQLPLTKQILLTLQAMGKFPSFPSLQFHYKGQNRKLGILGNSNFLKENNSTYFRCFDLKIFFLSFPSFLFQYQS